MIYVVSYRLCTPPGGKKPAWTRARKFDSMPEAVEYQKRLRNKKNTQWTQLKQEESKKK